MCPEGRRQGEALGLRQHAFESEACSGARGHARGWAVGSGRGRQLDASQVFDDQSAPRARPRAVEQNKKR
jgi:hypothetical protein